MTEKTRMTLAPRSYMFSMLDGAFDSDPLRGSPSPPLPAACGPRAVPWLRSFYPHCHLPAYALLLLGGPVAPGGRKVVAVPARSVPQSVSDVVSALLAQHTSNRSGIPACSISSRACRCGGVLFTSPSPQPPGAREHLLVVSKSIRLSSHCLRQG